MPHFLTLTKSEVHLIPLPKVVLTPKSIVFLTSIHTFQSPKLNIFFLLAYSSFITHIHSSKLLIHSFFLKEINLFDLTFFSPFLPSSISLDSNHFVFGLMQLIITSFSTYNHILLAQFFYHRAY